MDTMYIYYNKFEYNLTKYTIGNIIKQSSQQIYYKLL